MCKLFVNSSFTSSTCIGEAGHGLFDFAHYVCGYSSNISFLSWCHYVNVVQLMSCKCTTHLCVIGIYKLKLIQPKTDASELNLKSVAQVFSFKYFKQKMKACAWIYELTGENENENRQAGILLLEELVDIWERVMRRGLLSKDCTLASSFWTQDLIELALHTMKL